MGISELYVAIILGLTLSLLFQEKFGINPGGLVVPGYIALSFKDPKGVIVIFIISLLTYMIGALGPDLTVLADHELAREALLEHIGVVVHIVKADDERLFALGQLERVAHHVRAALVRDLAPHILDGDKNVALFIHGL